MKKVYFDNAATTQLRDEVIDTMSSSLKEVYGNPSSTHGFGRTAKAILEQARKTIAGYLNISAAEIIFTSGGTEADNLILNSAVRDLGVERIITTSIEHHAVLHQVDQLKDCFGTKIEYVKLTEGGYVDFQDLENLLAASDKKTLVSLMHVNNEVGNILDVKKVATLCKAHGALFHSDTVQSVGHYELDFQELGVDFAAVSAHKFHGPKGIGFAYIRKNSGMKSLIFGGSQERGLRAGTESVHNIAGMEEALKLAYEHLEEDRTYIEDLKTYFIAQLEKEVPGSKLNGGCCDFEKSTYTLINVCLPVSPEKAAMLLFQLDLNGIACSKGSACQSGSDKGSHVLSAILNEDDLKKPSVRFSFSHFNTKEDIDYVIEVLKGI